MKTKSKFLNILLAILLTVGMFTFNSVKVQAEQSGTYDNVNWRITDSGELIIGKEGETQTFTYRSDRYLNSYPWYSKWNNISSVRLAGVVNGNGSHRGMFYNFQVTSLDLTSFDTSNVTNMNSMFENCQATSLNLSNFDTSKVTGMQNMFRKSQATTLDLSSFNTSKVTNMNLMFAESQATSINLSSFNTSNVTDMGSMFENSKAASLNLSSFNTSKVTSMQKNVPQITGNFYSSKFI